MLLCYLCLDIIKCVCILYCVTNPDPTLKNADPDPMSLQYIYKISNYVLKDVNDQPEEKEEQNSNSMFKQDKDVMHDEISMRKRVSKGNQKPIKRILSATILSF